MLKFKLNKEKSDVVFNISECEISKDCRITIVEDKVTNTFGVYVRKYVREGKYNTLWYIEISNNNATDMKECKQVAEKMLDIVNGYKPPLPN